VTEGISRLPEPVRPLPLDSFERVLEPRKGLRATLRLGELWSYRELLLFLCWRDVKVRYRQTLLGAAWAVLQPFALMLVFTIFLGRLAHVPSEGLPYPIFVYAALVPWTLFSQSVSGVSDSLVSSANLISKVYFPRLVIPLGVAASYVIDFVIGLGLLVGMMVYYGVYPGLGILALPALLLLTVASALAVGIWFSALNVQYRDVKYTVPFLLQVWLFASPIAYATSLVPGKWQLVYSLNPMVSVINGFRWALLGTPWAPDRYLAISIGVIALLLVSGVVYFRRTERTFADVI
jgi:lipopolysaccharide transport system permease protein